MHRCKNENAKSDEQPTEGEGVWVQKNRFQFVSCCIAFFVPLLSLAFSSFVYLWQCDFFSSSCVFQFTLPCVRTKSQRNGAFLKWTRNRSDSGGGSSNKQKREAKKNAPENWKDVTKACVCICMEPKAFLNVFFLIDQQCCRLHLFHSFIQASS